MPKLTIGNVVPLVILRFPHLLLVLARCLHLPPALPLVMTPRLGLHVNRITARHCVAQHCNALYYTALYNSLQWCKIYWLKVYSFSSLLYVMKYSLSLMA